MFSGLKRDDKLVPIINNKDETSTTAMDIEVIVPVRYAKIGLCKVGVSVETLAIIAIKSGNKYKSIAIPAIIKFIPHKTVVVTYENIEYYVFHIAKGQKFADRRVVQNPDIIKLYVDETLVKGNLSFFTSYADIRNIYEKFHDYIGSNISDDVVIISVFISLIARYDKDLKQLWRTKKPTDGLHWVGVASVGLSRTDGYSQLTGAYMKEGIVAASLGEKDEPTEIELIIK